MMAGQRVSTAKVLGAAVVVQAMTAPGQTVGVVVFVDHFISDLGLDRAAVSVAYLTGTLIGALALPLIGRLIDRVGIRRAVAGCAVAFGVVLVAMAGVRGFASLTVGFVGTRALGQGALTLAATTSVAINFDRRRGWATGLKTACGGALMSVFPIVVAVLIAQIGWRAVWVVLGVAVWVVLVPLAASSALSPRAPVDAKAAVDAGCEHSSGWTLREALASPAFWVVSAGVALSALVSTGLIFHQVSMLTSRGLTTTEAATNFIPQSVAAALTALVVGRFADRVAPRWALAGPMTLLVAAPLVGLVISSGAVAVAYGLLLGAAGAAIRTAEGTVVPRWFGVAHIGEIRGLVMTVAVAASAAGPLVVAVLAGWTGGYGLSLLVFAVAGALAVVAAWRVPAPVRRAALPMPVVTPSGIPEPATA